MKLNNFMFILFAAMPELLPSGKLAVDKELTQGYDDSCVKVSDYIIPALVEALPKANATMLTTFAFKKILP